MRLSMVLLLALTLTGCDSGSSVVTHDTFTPDSTSMDASHDLWKSDTKVGDITLADAGLCVNWADMGIDCCDVCTEIYVTCGKSVKDKQGLSLTGKQCLDSCGPTGKAYNYVQCMMKTDGMQCDGATLQGCFDTIFN